MSDLYGGISNYPILLTMPTDGDPDEAATFRPALEGLADRTTYLEELRHSHTLPFSKWLPGTVCLDATGAGFWASSPSSFPTSPWTQYDPSAGTSDLVFDVDQLPDGCKLLRVDVYLDPATHTSVPASKPAAVLVEIDPTARTVTNLGSATSPATLAAYNAAHQLSIVMTSPGYTLNKASKMYRLVLTGESGANSLLGLQVWGVSAVFTITNLDPKAG